MIFYEHLEKEIREEAIRNGNEVLSNMSSAELREWIGRIYDEVLLEQNDPKIDERDPEKVQYCQILCSAVLNVIEAHCDSEENSDLRMFLWEFSKGITVMHEKESEQVLFVQFLLYSEDGIKIKLSTTLNGIEGYIGSERVYFLDFESETSTAIHWHARNLWQQAKKRRSTRTIDVGNGKCISYLK